MDQYSGVGEKPNYNNSSIRFSETKGRIVCPHCAIPRDSESLPEAAAAVRVRLHLVFTTLSVVINDDAVPELDLVRIVHLNALSQHSITQHVREISITPANCVCIVIVDSSYSTSETRQRLHCAKHCNSQADLYRSLHSISCLGTHYALYRGEAACEAGGRTWQ